MLILLYGKDSYRSRRKLNEIIAEYKKTHKSGLNLKFFDCEEKTFSVEDLKDEFKQYSMFREKKLIVVSEFFSDSVLKEKFLKEADYFSSSENILIIYEKDEIKQNDPLFKLLIKKAKTQEFKPLTGQNFRNWLKKELELNGAKIESTATDLLINYVGNDLWRLSNEIKKLANFRNKKTITAADVKLLVKPEIEINIFKTIDAIGEKNKKKALFLLHQHLENGDAPLYLLSMFNYQFRNLLAVKDLVEKNKSYNVILEKTGLHPFVVRKTYEQSRQFSLPELKKIYQKLFEVDINIKTGKVEPETALEMLVAEI